MANTTVKSTYALDVETVRQLDAMARRWNVSKSEALRRAIRTAAKQQKPATNEALNALNRLQDTLALTDGAATKWEKSLKRQRRASARRLER